MSSPPHVAIELICIASSNSTGETEETATTTPPPPTDLSRDLEKARSAHKKGDVQASIVAHQLKSVKASSELDASESNDSQMTRGWRPHSAATEEHKKWAHCIISI
jgi:hypothetical protein